MLGKNKLLLYKNGNGECKSTVTVTGRPQNVYVLRNGTTIYTIQSGETQTCILEVGDVFSQTTTSSSPPLVIVDAMQINSTDKITLDITEGGRVQAIEITVMEVSNGFSVEIENVFYGGSND